MRPIIGALLFVLLLSVEVDPQFPGFQLPTPRVRQCLALVNYLLRRPTGIVSVRRECRLIPRPELDAIFRAIRAAKSDTRLRPNVLDCFAFLHSHPDVNTAAHGGPGFLPWHRVFVYLYEQLLRMYEPTVSICFWDSTLEPDDARVSTSWTPQLFGNGNGPVMTGPGAGWVTPVGRLMRDVGQRGRPFALSDITSILSMNTLGEVSFPNGHIFSNVEEVHNLVHVHVGGHMGTIETAAYDPIFWFHHAFIDCIYEWFRNKQDMMGLVDVQRDWPRNFGRPEHGPFRPMRLGTLKNIDGENRWISKQMRCIRVPRCRANVDCGLYMTCDRTTSRCVSVTIATQRSGFFRGLRGMLGNVGNPGALGRLGNVFGGNMGSFSQNANGIGALAGLGFAGRNGPAGPGRMMASQAVRGGRAGGMPGRPGFMGGMPGGPGGFMGAGGRGGGFMGGGRGGPGIAGLGGGIFGKK